MQHVLSSRHQKHDSMHTRPFYFIFILSLFVLLAACGTPAASQSKPLDRVSVGTFGVLGDAPIYIALERGYFKQENIDVQIKPVTGGISELITSLANGQLDVGDGSATSALYNAFASNIKLKIVADNARTSAGRGGASLVVRNELAGVIKTGADLKGRKIAVLNPKGGTSLIYMDKLLTPAGLSLKDISFVGIPFPNMAAALSNGAVDLAIIVDPFLTTGLQKGAFKVFKDIGEIYPNQEANVMAFSEGFASKRDLAERFTIARLKGARDYYTAFIKNSDPALRKTIVSILTKYTSLKDPALYDKINFTLLDPNGRVLTSSMQYDLNWFVKDGDVKKPVDLSAVVDNSFVDDAVKTLGAYS